MNDIFFANRIIYFLLTELAWSDEKQHKKDEKQHKKK